MRGLQIKASVNQNQADLQTRFMSVRPKCLIPDFNGALFSLEWKEALWARFYTVAPQRQRQSVEQYKIVKRA
ncbi:hypothetical protein RvVAR0630_23740 [Agrobacterium vitis]|nr:hypothetical protein RvVAR0630_23740 [Agrobacterium vitis]